MTFLLMPTDKDRFNFSIYRLAGKEERNSEQRGGGNLRFPFPPAKAFFQKKSSLQKKITENKIVAPKKFFLKRETERSLFCKEPEERNVALLYDFT